MSYTRTYTTSRSTSQAVEDSKRKSLLTDGSWIKKDDEEDESVDRDPNYAKSVLSGYRSSETLEGSEPDAPKSVTSPSSSTSVQALTKRFGGSQDELNTINTFPRRTTYTRSTSSKSDAPETTTTTSINKDGKKTTETTITTSQTVSRSTKPDTFKERVFSEVKSSNTRTPYASYTLPTKSTKVTEKTEVKVTSNKKTEDLLFDTLIPKSIKDECTTPDRTPYASYTLPTKSTKVTEKTDVKVTSNKKTEDLLFDTLIPKSIKDECTTPDSKTSFSKTETVTVKTSMDGDGIKTTRTSSTAEDGLYNTLQPKSKSGLYSPVRDGVTTTPTTRTTSQAQDDLYDFLLPRSISSGLSSPTSTTSIVTVDSSKGDDSPTSTRTIKSYSSYSSRDDSPTTRTSSYTVSTDPSDYTSPSRSYSTRSDSSYVSSVTSPTSYTTPSYKDSRAEDSQRDRFVSQSSIKTVHSAPQRGVLEKDLCSYCHKPFTSEAKMILEDMKINCHASCFKCGVCNSSLAYLKAGDSMWLYRGTVHCENCFDVTRGKWRQ